jgi:hypothetical protein
MIGASASNRPQGWCSLLPQLRANGSTRPRKGASQKPGDSPHPTVTEVHELIGRMLEYEDIARDRGVNLASGRFRMLTKSERQFYRAELIADYIRLAICNLGDTPDQFSAHLETFCDKVCEMEVPSLELMGTYLASVDIVSQEERLSSIPELGESVRRTIISVLQSSVARLRDRTTLPSAAA